MHKGEGEGEGECTVQHSTVAKLQPASHKAEHPLKASNAMKCHSRPPPCRCLMTGLGLPTNTMDRPPMGCVACCTTPCRHFRQFLLAVWSWQLGLRADGRVFAIHVCV